MMLNDYSVIYFLNRFGYVSPSVSTISLGKFESVFFGVETIRFFEIAFLPLPFSQLTDTLERNAAIAIRIARIWQIRN